MVGCFEGTILLLIVDQKSRKALSGSKESEWILSKFYSFIAQSVEHAAVNRGVVGSSPTGGVVPV